MPGQGGLLQLVAHGKQDVFLTGNPQMTWFKMVYRRYTNFAIESQPMYFDGTPDFGKRITCLVPRRGDLLSQIVLEVSLPALTLTTGDTVSYVNSIGHNLIQEISLEIGEQEIDRQNGEWMEIWSSYTTPGSKQAGFYNMIGKVDGFTPPTVFGPQKLYIPLQFWFCRNPGLALPLIALQYHPVRINLTLRPLSQLFYSSALSAPGCSILEVKPASITELMLWGDYIYLDVDERRRFVSNTHEYLIEQIQYTAPIPVAPGATSASIRLEFNHPIRELFWFIQRDDMTRYHEYFNYSSLGIYETGTRQDILQDTVLQLDGFDRFQLRDAGYFRLVQPWQYHTVVPEDFFVYSYSFCLNPEDVQPSGSFNASRIDSVVLQVNLVSAVVNPTQAPPPPGSQAPCPNPGTLHARVYGINHNVLRIADGFGGVLFTI
uniref:Major capsid protein N-terminal domain-containing protein n=1 Tax=viral metagenome TaxID=1070528 RepID=A0A6C0DLK7_9ZZZZ